MIYCEIWMASGDIAAVNARFTVLPRIGEQVVISLDDNSAKMFVVKRIVHVDLNVHGNDAKPSIQLWVENA